VENQTCDTNRGNDNNSINFSSEHCQPFDIPGSNGFKYKNPAMAKPMAGFF